MAPLASVDELADFLDDQTLLEEYSSRAELLLDLASGLVRDYLPNTSLDQVVADDVVRVHGTGTTIMLLPGTPVVDVTSIIEDPDGAAIALTASDFDWAPEGMLEKTFSTWRRRYRWYEVTYSHGYADVPDGIKAVVLRVAARGIVNPEGLATEAVQNASVGYAFDDSRLVTLSGPDRRDLDHYRP